MIWCNRCNCINKIEKENWEYNEEIRNQISKLISLKSRVTELTNEKVAFITNQSKSFNKSWLNNINNKDRTSGNILEELNKTEQETKEILTIIDNLPLSQLSLEDIDFTATIPKLNMFRQILESSKRAIDIAENMKKRLAEWNGQYGLAGNLTPNNLLQQQVDEIWMDLLDIQEKLSSIQEIIAKDEIGTRKKQLQLKRYFDYKLSDENFQEIHYEALQKTNKNHIIADTVEYISRFQFIEDTLALQKYIIIKQIIYWSQKEEEIIYSQFLEKVEEINRIIFFFDVKRSIRNFSYELALEKIEWKYKHGFSDESWKIEKIEAKDKWAKVIKEEEKRLTQLEQEKNKWMATAIKKEKEKRLTQSEQEKNNTVHKEQKIKLLKRIEPVKIIPMDNYDPYLGNNFIKDCLKKFLKGFFFF